MLNFRLNTKKSVINTELVFPVKYTKLFFSFEVRTSKIRLKNYITLESQKKELELSMTIV